MYSVLPKPSDDASGDWWTASGSWWFLITVVLIAISPGALIVVVVATCVRQEVDRFYEYELHE